MLHISRASGMKRKEKKSGVKKRKEGKYKFILFLSMCMKYLKSVLRNVSKN